MSRGRTARSTSIPTNTAFAGEKGAWRDSIETLAQKYAEECVVYKANRLSKKARECVKDPNCRAEAVHQSPIRIAIVSKSFLPFLKQFKDIIGGC